MAVFNSQLTRMVEENLYVLKRLYGGRIVLCSLLDASTDHKTGVKTKDIETCHIKKAIVLPNKMTREVVESVARISMNKPLAYGGEFTIGDRGFIIQGSDAPKGWNLKQDDWIVYRGERYSIKMVIRTCGNTGWTVVARKHPGVPLTFHVTANSAITLFDEAAHE